MARRGTTLPEPNNVFIEQAIRVARETWKEWQDVFECTGRLNTNPILADPAKFSHFCTSWQVARTIRAGRIDDFRCLLRDSEEFITALDDPTGCALDQLHKNVLRARFGTQGGKRGVQSALSKVATFVRPESFTAWDSYASAGLNLVLGRSKSRWFENYARYLSDFNDVWNGPHGERIREMTKPIGRLVEAEPRFQRRVLDLYLMSQGGFKLE
jgi:hypothetical protein